MLSWLGGHHPPRRRMVGRDVGDDLYTPSAEIAPQRFEQSQALGIEAEAYEVRAVGGGPVHGVLLDLERAAALERAVVDEAAVGAQRLTITHGRLGHDRRLGRPGRGDRPAAERAPKPARRLPQDLVGHELLRPVPGAARGVDDRPAAVARGEGVDLAGPVTRLRLGIEDPGIEGEDRPLGNLVLAAQDLPEPDEVLDRGGRHPEVVELRCRDADQRPGDLHGPARAEDDDLGPRDRAQASALEAALVHVAIAQHRLAGARARPRPPARAPRRAPRSTRPPG